MSDDVTLVRDGQAWEALERAAGHDPDGLPYPPDIAARIERWVAEADGPVIESDIIDIPHEETKA